LPKFVWLNGIFLALIFLLVVVIFQGFERAEFDCEIWGCQNPHILYTLGLPLFVVVSGTILYLLYQNRGYLAAKGESRTAVFWRHQSRALVWIGFLMTGASYVGDKIATSQDFRGPLVLGVLLSMLYTLYNIICLLSAPRKTRLLIEK
jgi:uncharacterized integral membrane protein